MYADLKTVEEKYKYTDFPLNIAIEVTNYCNLNCVMCKNDQISRPRGIMSMTLYKKIVDEIAKENKNTRIWLDFYGEALIAGWKVYYMIDYAKKCGLTNVCINTNGTLMNKEYADMLLDANTDYISLDCDGFSKEVYESIRVKGNRDELYRNIEYLLEEKKRRNSKVIVDVKIIEMEENKHEVKQVLEYWQKKGCWTAVRRRAEWAFDEHNKSIDEERIACGHTFGTMAISWDGYAAECPWDCDLKMPCGDVNAESIKDIWKRHTNTFLVKHKEHKWDELPEICRGCSSWKYIGEERYDEYGNEVIRSYEADGTTMMETEREFERL